MDGKRARLVALAQELPEGLRAPLGKVVFVAATRVPVGLTRGKVHLVDDGVEVEAGTPAQDGGAAAIEAFVNEDAGVALEHGHGVVLRDVGHIDHLERHEALLDGRLGRADVHATVDLHRVDRDDVGAKAQCHLVGKRALARGRGANDADDGTACGGTRHETVIARRHRGSPTMGPRRYHVRASSTRTSTSLPTSS